MLEIVLLLFVVQLKQGELMGITKYYFVSTRDNESADGYLMVSTSKGLTHAKKIAEKRFQEYGYKGRVVNIYPFSASNGKAIAV